MGTGSFPLLRIRQSSRSETCNLLASSWIVTSQASAPSDHLSKSVSVILIEPSSIRCTGRPLATIASRSAPPILKTSQNSSLVHTRPMPLRPISLMNSRVSPCLQEVVLGDRASVEEGVGAGGDVEEAAEFVSHPTHRPAPDGQDVLVRPVDESHPAGLGIGSRGFESPLGFGVPFGDGLV